MSTEEPDSCASCGLPDVLDGDDPTAHWNIPTGVEIVAWTCSAKCADALEETRGADGVLKQKEQA